MNNGQILKESIEAHEKAIAEAKDKLKALDEPELKHGDLRLWSGVWPGCLGIVDKSETQMHMIWPDGDKRSRWLTEEKILQDSVPAGTMGDIFDDLNRNSEDLKGFEVDASCVDWQKGCCLGIGNASKPDDLVYFSVEPYDKSHKVVHFNLDQATEIHQKLGQIIATARRKQTKS